ncbi:MAG: Uncharacterized protein XD77_1338 [Marinimicrobia bacterium 46_47]|nr:MAG: Uncharacterized protein XD77_1338 [Marinimicrobia bacterium 46_47]
MAENYALDPAYPNPFNVPFTLPFSLNESMHVTVDLFTLNGRKLMTVVDYDFGTGNHELMVNTDNLASDLYVVRTVINGHPNLQKVVLLK